MDPARTTLIVGASPDLVEVASILGRNGERIGLMARTEGRLKQHRERLTSRHVEAEYFIGDVTEIGSVQGSFAQYARWAHRLDRLIYNVGAVSHETASEITSRGLHRVMSPNFFGFVNCMQFALPLFRANGGGHVITVAGIHSLDETQPVAYAASQASLRIYVSALRRELTDRNVHLSEVLLGQKPEATGWRDLVCEEIVDGILHVVAQKPDRFTIGEPSESATTS